MKTIIAGSRTILDFNQVLEAISTCPWSITEVVSGKAVGVDTLGEQYAAINSIPVNHYPADWKKYGQSAGFRRNQQMLEYSDALIAVWDGKSRGTADMITRSRRAGISVHVVIPSLTIVDTSEFS